MFRTCWRHFDNFSLHPLGVFPFGLNQKLLKRNPARRAQNFDQFPAHPVAECPRTINDF